MGHRAKAAKPADGTKITKAPAAKSVVAPVADDA
jgi:hypothetical protein